MWTFLSKNPDSSVKTDSGSAPHHISAYLRCTCIQGPANVSAPECWPSAMETMAVCWRHCGRVRAIQSCIYCFLQRIGFNFLEGNEMKCCLLISLLQYLQELYFGSKCNHLWATHTRRESSNNYSWKMGISKGSAGRPASLRVASQEQGSLQTYVLDNLNANSCCCRWENKCTWCSY